MLVFGMLLDRLTAATIYALARYRDRSLGETILGLVSGLVDEYSDHPGFPELKEMAADRRKIWWATAVERVLGERPSEGDGTVKVVATNSSSREHECEAAATLALLLAEKGTEPLAQLARARAQQLGLL